MWDHKLTNRPVEWLPPVLYEILYQIISRVKYYRIYMPHAKYYKIESYKLNSTVVLYTEIMKVWYFLLQNITTKPA